MSRHMNICLMSHCQCEFTRNPRAEPRQRRVGFAGRDKSQPRTYTRANRTRHTTSSSTQPQAKQPRKQQPTNVPQTNLSRVSQSGVVLRRSVVRRSTADPSVYLPTNCVLCFWKVGLRLAVEDYFMPRVRAFLRSAPGSRVRSGSASDLCDVCAWVPCGRSHRDPGAPRLEFHGLTPRSPLRR